MRLKGTKYEKVNKLPNNALSLRDYAEANGMCSGAYVQVKYDRFKEGYKKSDGTVVKGENPGYKIVCWNGINFAISDKKCN